MQALRLMVLLLTRTGCERICSPYQYPDLHLLEYFHSTSEPRPIFEEFNFQLFYSVLNLVKILVHPILEILPYLRCFGLQVLHSPLLAGPQEFVLDISVLLRDALPQTCLELLEVLADGFMLESGHGSIPEGAMLLFKDLLIATFFGRLKDSPQLAFIGGDTFGNGSLALVLADVGPSTLNVWDTPGIDGSRVGTIRW